MELVITLALMMALLLLFTKVKAMLAQPQSQPVEITRAGLLALLGVSFWLGFIVLDGNTYLLLVPMGAFHFDLPHANALKVLLLIVSSVMPVGIYLWSGSIWWADGLILSAGGLAGGHVGVQPSLYKNARRSTYRLLVLAISLEVAICHLVCRRIAGDGAGATCVRLTLTYGSGRRLRVPDACSNWCPTRSTVASPQAGPMISRPSGRPDAV
jgi:uncharacterized membrane protein YfcA